MSKKLLLLVAVVMVVVGSSLIAYHAGAAPLVAPAYDISGNWRFSGGGTAAFFQSGAEVTEIFNGGGFYHLFTGRYESATSIRGTVTRRNPANCTTTLAVTIEVTSADAMAAKWVALDGFCDLKRGQAGEGDQFQRVPPGTKAP